MTARYEVRQTTTTGLLFAIYDREEKRILTPGLFKREADLILSALNNLAAIESVKAEFPTLDEVAEALHGVIAENTRLENNLATAKAGLEAIRKLGITHASEIARATLAELASVTPPVAKTEAPRT